VPVRTAGRPKRRSRLVSSIGLTIAFVALLAPTRGDVHTQTVSAKLTTLLADVARTVSQDSGSALTASTAAAVSMDTMPKSVQDALHGQVLRMSNSRDIQVYVLMDVVNNDEIAQLTAAGATIEIPDAPHGRVQARIPASRLQAVAALPFVNFIRLPSYAHRSRVGSATTEGDAIIQSDVARQQFGLDGTGVNVGVLSDGIKGIFAAGCTNCSGVANGPIATGNLPQASGTRNARGVLTGSTGGVLGRSFQADSDLEGLPSGTCSFAGAGAEGTALLEVVHDIAPGAQLSFANADTDVAFNQAVNFLASSNDVVVDDLGFFGLPYDGTSSVSSNTSAALNNNGNPIRTYVTSNGNDADEHYIGGYTASGVDGSSVSGISNSGHLHLFQSSADTTDVLNVGAQPYNLVALPRGGEIVIFLTWDDQFGHSGNNYDLYLVSQTTGAVVAKSADVQSGSGDPIEALDYVSNLADGLFRIVIQNVHDAAQARTLNLFSFEPECATSGPLLLVAGHHERHNFNTASRSAQGAFSGSPAPDESCLDRNHATAEFFASRGPTLDGRIKPDISAIDGVAVSGAGSFVNPFFGTSAAAPHVAGEAALVLQGASCLNSRGAGAIDPVAARTALRSMIISGATPLSDAPPDNVFGAGLANALASVRKTLPALTGPPTLVVGGNSTTGASLSPADLGFTDPNACPLTRVSWAGGCGSSPGATLNCPFGTSTVTVSASNSGTAFSDPVPMQIVVTNFGVAGTPASVTVPAGSSAQYKVTVAAQGGAFGRPVTLGCSNLPQGATCTFVPATVTPGAASVDTTLTITTTARSASLTVSRSMMAGGLAAMAFVAFVLLAAKVRPRQVTSSPVPQFVSLAVVILTVFVGVAQSSCGGGGSSSGGNGGNNGGGGNGGGGGTGTPATATLSSTSLTFGATTVSATSASQNVTLTNGGGTALAVTSIVAGGDFAQTNTCGASVAAGGNCAITVTFKPTVSGPRTGSITITDSASGSPQTITLAGSGAVAAGGTPAGNYQIGVIGTSGLLQQSGAVLLVVQ
jgi:hypothetical protein